MASRYSTLLQENPTQSKPVTPPSSQSAGEQNKEETHSPESTPQRPAKTQETVEPWKHTTTELRKHVPTEPINHGTVGLAKRFDLNRTPHVKYTLTFTESELEALDDAKILLRRRYDVRVSKTDIVRIGIHELLQDLEENGEESRVVRMLKRKRL